MKVVIVSQAYYPRPGGVSEHVHHTAAELRRRGHHVTIVTSHCAGAAPDPDTIRIGRNMLVPINGAWVNMTVGTNLRRELATVFDRLEPDVIHTHCPLAPTLPLLTLGVAPASARVVGTFHAAASSSLGYRIARRPLARAARRLDSRIAVSAAAVDLATTYFPGRYDVIPNGVDCTRFSPTRSPIRELCDGAFNILFVGRLDRRKGLKYLFRAVALASRRTRRRLRLIVVGDDGLRRRALPRMPASVEVIFAGLVDRDMLPRYFVSGDVFVSPATERESFGIVLLEAMASGVPVVGTSIPGYLTVLRDRRNALVVPPRNSIALAESLVELIENRQLRERLSTEGLRCAARYAWHRVVDRLEHVYGHPAPAWVAVDAVADASLHVQKA